MGKTISSILIIQFNNWLSIIIYSFAKLSYFFNIWGLKDKYIFVLKKHLEITNYSVPNIFLELLILAEDRKYFFHKGIDVFAIFRAIFCNILGERQGASTITQQYIRIITNNYECSIKRKIQEITLALLCNKKLDKIETASKYLSIAYFGYNMLGIRAAINVINNNNSCFTPFQAALIISHLKYPSRYNPKSEYLQKVKIRATYLNKIYKTNKYFYYISELLTVPS